jgi:hypothetical protein
LLTTLPVAWGTKIFKNLSKLFVFCFFLMNSTSQNYIFTLIDFIFFWVSLSSKSWFRLARERVPKSFLTFSQLPTSRTARITQKKISIQIQHTCRRTRSDDDSDDRRTVVLTAKVPQRALNRSSKLSLSQEHRPDKKKRENNTNYSRYIYIYLWIQRSRMSHCCKPEHRRS